MKKSIKLLFVISIAIILAVLWFDRNNSSVIYHDPVEVADENPLKIDVADVHQGELLLVNEEYGIKESAKTDIKNLYKNQELTGDYGLLTTDIALSKEITAYFNEMIEGAKKDGVNNFLISSGYRSFEEQTKLYQEKGRDYALPGGYSEHQLGLALDVGSSEGTMAEAAEGKWIAENAWQYGFVLRYPQAKTDVTGIQYEPWHIRYVGKPHSVIMQDKNFVLEEYLAYLREKEQISATVDGKEYNIRYYAVSKAKKVKIPKGYNYTISGDNVGGVIITLYK
ncbi:D-alanyl-D-alanine carboxypeptidase family protein [Virgibacillus dokdonensis]|uniref:D-alanyl-D-alanine carboxypeptidase n=2 Tax=Virgibacillus TaxID=84406 RepID=A0A2K9IWN0_9BACI|nr:M15 family metallopeptidase [Virgibacillus dokdonensis]AUJ23824.1 D-alanyl-D-alanine carboxypeptidase [Virgibacillus dokdonensis]